MKMLSIFLPALVAMAAVFGVYFKVLRLAKVKRLFDNPEARKLQKEPVPVLGGLAVYIGVLAGLAVALCIAPTTVGPLLPVVLMMAVMLYTGSLDDIMGVPAATRLLLEIGAVLVLVYGSGQSINTFHGLWGIYHLPNYVAVPLTVFAGVGIINAINMVDGVNGLSSGLCVVCCALFGISFLQLGDMPDALLAFVMLAAIVPFLLHNVFGSTSRMFIGDAGTMTMGIITTWFLIRILNTSVAPEALSPGIGLVSMCLALLIVPVFDTLRVMTMRIVRGLSPFHPDKTHLHHAFVDCGFSHCFTAFCEVLIGLVTYGLGFASHHLGASVSVQLYITIACGILLVWGPYVFLSRAQDNRWIQNLAKHSHWARKGWWLKFQQWLDAPEKKRMKNE